MGTSRLRWISDRHPYVAAGIPYACMTVAYLMLRFIARANHITVLFLLIGTIVVLTMGCIAGTVAYRVGRPIIARALAFIGAAISGLYAAAYLFVGTVGTR